jgi:hypothetical protein
LAGAILNLTLVEEADGRATFVATNGIEAACKVNSPLSRAERGWASGMGKRGAP